MAYKVFYEWRVNKMDGWGDIEDFYTFASYKEARECERQLHAEGLIPTHWTTEIELGRDEWCEDDGLQDRGYATVGADGKLPERFCCGNKVPAYKQAEVQR